MKIKNFLTDVTGASRVTKRRNDLFEQASSTITIPDPILDCAKALHPGYIKVEVQKIEEVTISTKRFTLKAVGTSFPPFEAGQYLSLRLQIDSVITTRPYSISSAPSDAIGKDGFIQITVKKRNQDGFVANYLCEKIKVGDSFDVDMPYGDFYYEELRDSKNIVCLAGGSGITPFYSMAKEVSMGKLDINLTILYGSVSTKDIILEKELEELSSPKIKVVPVISGPEAYSGEKGFLTREIIQKYSKKDTTYFICGPRKMLQFVKNELQALNVPTRRVRCEIFGNPKEVWLEPDYPKDVEKEVVNVCVIQGIQKTIIQASCKESLATSLERNGIKAPTRCRSGICGFCRSKLLEGKVYCPKNNDYRRKEDILEGFIHLCSSYPLSDVTVKIPII